MRTAAWVVVAAGVAGLVPMLAGGQPPATAAVRVKSLKDATTRFAEKVAADAGKADLKFKVKARPELGRSGYLVAVEDMRQVFQAKGIGFKCEPAGALALGPDEQFVIEVTNPAGGRSYRFAAAAEKQRDPTNPARELTVLRCSLSKTMAAEFHPNLVLADQEQVGKILGLSTQYSPRSGLSIQLPAADPAPGAKVEPVTQIDAPGMGTIRFHKRTGPEEIDFDPLPFEPHALQVSSSTKTWRYRCKDLKAETAFEVVVVNRRPHAYAIEVMLDGRSSTEGAGKYMGSKYIIPGTPEGTEPVPYAIKGWLLEPKGKLAGGTQSFEYAEFLVKNVPDADPVLAETTAESRSTVRIAWYGAWPKGTPRPATLNNPQGGSDVVTQGNHGTVDLRVVEYVTDEHSAGSVVVEYGGRAARKSE